MAGDNYHRARTCIETALSIMEGFEVPLAAWRVHASTAELEKRLGDRFATLRDKFAEANPAINGTNHLSLAGALAPSDEPRRDGPSAVTAWRVLWCTLGRNGFRSTRPHGLRYSRVVVNGFVRTLASG
jgi:hypothetical protein